MSNPLLESAVVRTGSRLAFRYSGLMVDPFRDAVLGLPPARLINPQDGRIHDAVGERL